MRRLLQQDLLDARALRSLFSTCHATAHAVQQQQQPLALRRHSAGDWPDHLQSLLLAKWAVADLALTLAAGGPAAVPAPVRPLVTTLRLDAGCALTRADLEALQHFHRLTALDLDPCAFDATTTSSSTPALAVQPLPQLRSLSVVNRLERGRRNEPVPQQWAVDALLGLCACAEHLAVDAWRTERLMLAALAALPRLQRCSVAVTANAAMLRALLAHPALQHVSVPRVSLAPDQEDLRALDCRWRTLALDECDVKDLRKLPLKEVERVTVKHMLDVPDPGAEQDAMLVEVEGLGPELACGTHLAPSPPVCESWDLAAPHEQEGGYFRLSMGRVSGACAGFLRRHVLPPGGGPTTLNVYFENQGVDELMRGLAPLLEGTRVRTLCLQLHARASLTGVLPLLPRNVERLVIALGYWDGYGAAAEMLDAPPSHPLELMLIEREFVDEDDWPEREELLEEVMEAFARLSPPVEADMQYIPMRHA